MLYRDLIKVLGYHFLGFSFLLIIPLMAAFYFEFLASEEHPQPHSTFAFFETIVISFAIAASCLILGRHAKGKIFKREALAIGAILWFTIPALGSLPFLFSGTILNPLHAYFEMTSGFTTTGVTILEAKRYDPYTGIEKKIEKEIPDPSHRVHMSYYGTVIPVRNPKTFEIQYEGIEAVGKALLLWRSLSQWIGGFIVILLFIAVLPALGFSGKFLFQPSITGPLKTPLIPRVAQAALQLGGIYLFLSLFEILLLKIFNQNMSAFDALTLTFSNISGGGFTIHNANLGYYQNTSTEWIVILFMILGGTNFTLFYYAIRGKFYRIYKAELYVYLCMLLFFSLIGSWFLLGTEKFLLGGIENEQGVFSLEEAIRYGFFHIISAQTTTGFALADYTKWPYSIQTLMLIVMFIGGMSGSTAGGMKVIRQCIFYFIARVKTESLFEIEPVKRYNIGGQEIDNETIASVLCIIAVWFLSTTLATFLFIIDGVDQQTSFGLTSALINNCALTFHMAGPSHSCAFLSNFGLLLSSFLMILGRVEFFAIFALLMPSFWKSSL